MFVPLTFRSGVEGPSPLCHPISQFPFVRPDRAKGLLAPAQTGFPPERNGDEDRRNKQLKAMGYLETGK
jgi:hypothetical protein